MSIAKTIRLALDAASVDDARAQVDDMCQRLLANPVIERYTVEITEAPCSVTHVGVVVFPGTNCELDVVWAVEQLGAEAELLWHGDESVHGVDAVVVPGGFAHGDYLRTGAIARFSPVMTAVAEHAAAGGPVVGICNGFQVLTEAGLLPGALQKNAGLTFVCDTVDARGGVDPVGAHRARASGARCASRSTTSRATTSAIRRRSRALQDDDRIVLRYVDNPNGSLDDIAGISNDAGNVVGLMPHPERASDPLLGSADGQILLQSSAGSVRPRSRGSLTCRSQLSVSCPAAETTKGGAMTTGSW